MGENNLTMLGSMLSLLIGSDLKFFILFGYVQTLMHLHMVVRVKPLLMNLKIITKFHCG
jgi:hypothetical protein